MIGYIKSASADTQALAEDLRKHSEGEVLFTEADRARYATDASIYQQMPLGVFVPRTQGDVKVAIELAREHGASILPRGGGTSQCGQTTGRSLVIDTSKYLRRILALDVSTRRVTVEPGIVLDHLNAHLKSYGLWFPVDVSTSAQATLGGMAGNNSCGSRSIAYGNMVHNVVGIDAWLADGTVEYFGRIPSVPAVPPFQQRGVGKRAAQLGEHAYRLAQALREEIERHWPKVMRRVAGYNLDIFCNQSERPYTQDGSVNLAHLLVGSEGTLAFTQSLTLALAELPRHRVLGVVNFPTFHAAMDAAQHIVKLGPTAVELVDRTMIDLSLGNPAFAPTIRAALIGEPEAVLLVEFAGEAKVFLEEKLLDLEELMGELGLPKSVVKMTEEVPQKELWEVRKAGLNIMMSLKGDGKPVSFIEDCAVPLEHLAEYTAALTEVFAKHGTRGTWYAHASVGTLHVRPILDMRRDGAAKMRAIAEEAAALVRKYKGAFSGEHGDGLCRGEWIAWQFGPKINEAFRQIKQAFDPDNLFNPGKIVDPPKMDDPSLFRFPPTYKTIPIKTALDWRAWDVQNDPLTEALTPPGTGGDAAQGFGKAVEMCNNNGHCRKFDAGTMCPSYRVTRDESASTRGRANTLRMAVSGQLAGGLSSEAVREALDLCVSCKGCKRECPTGVDMARMKIEVLHQYHQTHPRTLGQRLIAHLPRVAWLARFAPGIVNAVNKLPWVKRLLNVAPQRSLPAFRRDTAWNATFKGAVSAQALLQAKREGRACVVLFVDTFNAAYDVENVHAALEVLQAVGVHTHVLVRAGAHLCCGRTYLASGMVDAARERLRALIEALHPFAEAGIDIVGLEPSCTFTLRDEALAMGLGEQAQRVATHAKLIDTYLLTQKAALAAALVPTAQNILVHGHCHQKAFAEITPTIALLKLIANARVTLIESSCCGMAGAFGYEASHYAVSMKMAEVSLLPAIRKDAEAIIVADGTSCRHQIADGAERQAMHLVRVLAAHLKRG